MPHLGRKYYKGETKVNKDDVCLRRIMNDDTNDWTQRKEDLRGDGEGDDGNSTVRRTRDGGRRLQRQMKLNGGFSSC
ncbi:uncharacterized protein G2W53_027054 [Senna tora]|uniref:Uncharacterized protein n=1 Tax=Senna tora TaxID=362788 RepID=A0A834WLW8_9FABA|nr:uncharacterized protein G2W53_027054 [Senna tora]